MKKYSRFAVYYAPEAGAFADFAAEWLGWDAARGRSAGPLALPGLPMPANEITATPRKYGFHGTIKPPFGLATSPGALEADLAVLCAHLAPVTLDGLALHRLGGFLALTPEGDTAPLAALAAEVVQGLDRHRQPPTQAELDRRRRAADLTPRQQANLATWGYPYVMDDFRFHLTLTGKLSEAALDQSARALDPVLAPLLPRPFRIKDLCLFGEDEDGMFHLLNRYTLAG
ncbi:DUF1045 domain-containing protein [Maritimibacter sp. HL-12]|uniref:DUF1045 domain-containing protein n=1 Tax=Maritimibacter sp. HL-12 TaxID=1162418 RepID=UPI000A0F163B|nr:DUF1045 domain-containing protein [Maritimibacter sp. HL-12]SMH53568.1 Protein of unknown function [Maritimibacter sp. HL-12]